MIENFITDEYLKKFHPNLMMHLWPDEQADYSVQINLAYQMLINDLHNKGIEVKQIMLQKDLAHDSTDEANTPLKYETKTETTTGRIIAGFNERRFVVIPTAVSGTWSIKLQGNNWTSLPTDTDLRWVDVPDASITIDGTVKRSVVFNEEYRWYRYVLTSSSSGSITFAAYLIETIFDDVIAYGALSLIFSDFMKETGDRWDILRQQDREMYNLLLDNARFGYDNDKDGLIDASEEKTFIDQRLKR